MTNAFEGILPFDGVVQSLDCLCLKIHTTQFGTKVSDCGIFQSRNEIKKIAGAIKFSPSKVSRELS